MSAKEWSSIFKRVGENEAGIRSPGPEIDKFLDTITSIESESDTSSNNNEIDKEVKNSGKWFSKE